MGIKSEDTEATIGLLISDDNPCSQSPPSNFPTTRSSVWKLSFVFRGLALALAAVSGVLLLIFAMSHVELPVMSSHLGLGATSLFGFPHLPRLCFHCDHKTVQPSSIAQPAMPQTYPTAQTVSNAPLMSFYMYRAQGDKEYSPRNVNLGDLPGVMWYLHNEVVKLNPRKFGITRIVRYRVTLRPTNFTLASTGAYFGPYVAYDFGKCTVPECFKVQRETGFVAGCTIPARGHGPGNTVGLGHYVSLTTVPCKPPHCKEGVWYSLPAQGGNCQIDDQKISVNEIAPVTGTPGCTYFAKWAGEVHLNELIGLPPNQAAYNAYVRSGNQEYNVGLDHGVCHGGHHCSFWNGRNNQLKCAQRQRYIMHLFDRKYPLDPKTYELRDSPLCPDLRPINFY